MEIKIEPAKKEDARRLLEIYTPYILNTAITFEYTIPSVEEFAQRIENTLINYPYLVAKKDDLIIGYAYTSAFKVELHMIGQLKHLFILIWDIVV